VVQNRDRRGRLGTGGRLVPIEGLAPSRGVRLKGCDGVEAVQEWQALTTAVDVFEEEELVLLRGIAGKRRSDLAIGAIEKADLVAISICGDWSTQRTSWRIRPLL
jgi:hypothetical protein